MDSRTHRLLTSINDYIDNPPPGVPQQLMQEIETAKEMLSAPLYSQESPGEQEAREVAKETMPEDAYEQMYPDDVTTEVGL